MEIRIHGNHISIDDELRSTAEEKVARAAPGFLTMRTLLTSSSRRNATPVSPPSDSGWR